MEAKTTNAPTRRKKQPSAYALFIQKHYDSVRGLKLRDRFRELARRWQAAKKSESKQAPVGQKKGKRKKSK